MTQDEKYKLKKRKEFLDERYLERQLHNIVENKVEILLRVELLKIRFSTKTTNQNKLFIGDRQFIELLAINTRTALLLRNNGYIRFFMLNGYFSTIL